MDKNKLFRMIPKVDVILADETVQSLVNKYSYDVVIEAVRDTLTEVRNFISCTDDEDKAEAFIAGLISGIKEKVENTLKPDVVKVINGTGTILHTNLGRAPLSKKHMERLGEIASGYCNLEYDLKEGKRGERYSHFEELLCKITGAEAAMAVNNNAAAVILILSTLAKGGEAIVSRGELVEVGGKFRIPDVMELSGARLKEVGTTNKTHLSDYEDAISEDTKVLMKVHTSNYKILGFTESVSIDELMPLKEKYDIPVVEDLGSGVLVNLEKYGLDHEPTVQESVKAGADIVCFSGDKLLGGPQAGIIVGKKKYIDAMKKNQYTRAFRIDKFTATALELVLMEYLSLDTAEKNIPVLNMIARPLEEVTKDAEMFCRKLDSAGLLADIHVTKCDAQIGGGSLPYEIIESAGVAVKPLEISTSCFEERLRNMEVPVVGRIVNDELILDMRTFDTDFEDKFISSLINEKTLEAEGKNS